MTKTFEILNFGHCNLFVICNLGFGIYNHKLSAGEPHIISIKV
jgi:hypothetical protein